MILPLASCFRSCNLYLVSSCFLPSPLVSFICFSGLLILFLCHFCLVFCVLLLASCVLSLVCCVLCVDGSTCSLVCALPDSSAQRSSPCPGHRAAVLPALPGHGAASERGPEHRGLLRLPGLRRVRFRCTIRILTDRETAYTAEWIGSTVSKIIVF